MPATDGKDYIFTNLEDKSQVIGFDAELPAVLHRYPLAPSGELTGFNVLPITDVVENEASGALKFDSSGGSYYLMGR